MVTTRRLPTGRDRHSAFRGDGASAPSPDSPRGFHAARPDARSWARGRDPVGAPRSGGPVCIDPRLPCLPPTYVRQRGFHEHGANGRRGGNRYGRRA
jgi:hypothetical protein